VIGIVAEHEGHKVRIKARRGVLLTAGGFAHNAQMRKEYEQQPIGTSWV